MRNLIRRHLLGLTVLFPALSLALPHDGALYLEYGPWHNDTRLATLKVGDAGIHHCLIYLTAQTDKPCPFLTSDEGTSSLVLDENAALTLLYHKSGLNRDGSRRYFYHRWLGVE